MKISMAIMCPAGSEDCPYYAKGWCQMKEETGDHPRYECDDYGFFADEDEEEDEEEDDDE